MVISAIYGKRKRILLKTVKSGDIETLNKLQKKSAIAGYNSHGNFDCFASKNQTITFEKPFCLV